MWIADSGRQEIRERARIVHRSDLTVTLDVGQARSAPDEFVDRAEQARDVAGRGAQPDTRP